MMANEPGQAVPLAQSQTAVAPNDEARFDRAALLYGRSLFWDPAPINHAQYVIALIRWCLDLPGARLGISPHDVAKILRGTYNRSTDQIPPEVQFLFERFGVTNLQVVPWIGDEKWRSHRSDLVRCLASTSQGHEYIWLDEQDAKWWLEATNESLLSYAELFDLTVDSDVIFDLLNRHRCTVFAPYDGGATWDGLVASVTAVSDASRQAIYLERLQRGPFTRENCAAITGAFWSWRLIDFSKAEGSLIYSPLFAAWNYWPDSAEWAPASQSNVTPQASITSVEMAHLLNDVFWLQMETVFSMARVAFGLGQASTELANIEVYPPVFFYAGPITRPLRAEEYAESLREAISPLVSGCLLSEDPLSAQMSWGLLEGHLVALRSEISSSQSYRPRYLIFPTAASDGRPIESDIIYVADRLTYLEFTIGLEAKNTSAGVEALSVRSSLWGGTLDEVADVTVDAATMLTSVRRRDIRVISTQLESFQIVLQQMENAIERGANDFNDTERRYLSYLDATDDLLRRQFTASVIPHITATGLRDALVNAYPYQYVQQPLKALKSVLGELRSTLEHARNLSTWLDGVFDRKDRKAREQLAQLVSRVGLLIALLALLEGLPQFVGSNSSKLGVFSNIPFLSQVPEFTPALRMLLNLVGFWLVVAGIALFFTSVSSIGYTLAWLFRSLPRGGNRFIEDIQRFRAVISASANARAKSSHPQRWRDLDNLDDIASALLAGLWQSFRHTRDEIDNDTKRSRRSIRGVAMPMPGAREWAVRAHALEQRIELFDLAPATITLPRTLCVFRFKTTDFYRRTTISERDFSASLRTVGFTSAEVNSLESWLSAPENQRQIREWDVATLARVLKRRGVSVVESERKPEMWQGLLDNKS